MNKDLFNKFRAWLKNHPDVWHKDEHDTPHFWWVINCLGDLYNWDKEITTKLIEISESERVKHETSD